MTKRRKENKAFILSLDSSSSACKAYLIDRNGFVFKESSVPLISFSPKPGWLEHDPKEIWENQLKAIEIVLEGFDLDLLVGISITNQRETVIAWDSQTRTSIGRAISWQDNRNDSFLRQYKEKEELIKLKTGLYLNSYFSVSKIRWILENEKYNLNTLRVGTVDSWIIAHLTNHEVFATDITNASRTLLFNLDSEMWDDELFELFNIPKHIMPSVFPSGHFYGNWIYKGKKIPILGVIGDQQAALLSTGFNFGNARCMYGTGLFFMVNIGKQKLYIPGITTTVAWKIGNKSTIYALETGSFVCGNFISDLNKEGLFNKYEINDCQIDHSIFLKLKKPNIFIFDDHKYFDFSFGVDPKKDKGEKILKAAINSIALISLELFKLFQSNVNISKIFVGGSLTKIDYLNKLQSSLFGVPVIKYNIENHSAIGAAIMAFEMIKNEYIKFDYLLKNLVVYRPCIGSEKLKKLIYLWNTYKISL